MDTEQNAAAELSLNEAVALTMEDLPLPIQQFLQGPERDRKMLALSQKYQLHADQAGEFNRSLILMLLGLYTPEEFTQQLRAAGIADDTIRPLTEDVNEQIFKPLQQAQRSDVRPVPPAPPPAPPPRMAIPAADPMPPPPPRPIPPAPSAPPVTTIAPSVPAPLPVPRTMARDMEAILHPDQAPAGPSHAQSSSARSFQTASIPNTVPAPLRVPPLVPPSTPSPPRPMPPSSPPAPAPQIPPPPPASTWKPTPPDAAPGANRPIVKEYGVDPYREAPE